MDTARTSSMSRERLAASHLYAILDREFKRKRSSHCKTCTVPLPYYQRPPDDVSANWFIGQPVHCRFGCHIVIAELLAELWTRYDIDRTPPLQ